MFAHRAAALLLTAGLLCACGTDEHKNSETGSIVVTVTLTRQGPPGPNIDHVPQSGIDVTVTDNGEGRWSGRTDAAGEAQVSVPAGEYDVGISSCPDGPHHVAVSAGGTTTTRFDCLAA